MEFQEFDKNLIIIDNEIKNFVYFLLKNNQVVYVGKTTTGFFRPFSHRDKIFDTMIALPCSSEDLDKLEVQYIKKYKPMYNSIFVKYKKNLILVEIIIPKVKNLYFPFWYKVDVEKLKKFAYSNGITPYIESRREYVDWNQLKCILDINKDKLDCLIYKKSVKELRKNIIHITEKDHIRFKGNISKQKMNELGYLSVDNKEITSRGLDKSQRENIIYQKIIERKNDLGNVVVEISNIGAIYLHYERMWCKKQPVKKGIEKYIFDLIDLDCIEINKGAREGDIR